MMENNIKEILKAVGSGLITDEEAFEQLKILPYENIGFACLDHHRSVRTGQAEVVFCQGKEVEHIITIIECLGEHNSNVLATRLDSEKAKHLLKHFPDAQYDSLARCFLLHPLSEPTFKGQILIITAGTADLPVAREAWLTARYLGHEAEILLDVGVSGIHRLLDKQHLLEQAEVIIVAAGMEGALVSVVGGLVQQPVIAVPTSIGYGAHFQGLAPLLSMLNSCASGVGVVNIDNGFGAASLASTIIRRLLINR